MHLMKIYKNFMDPGQILLYYHPILYMQVKIYYIIFFFEFQTMNEQKQKARCFSLSII